MSLQETVSAERIHIAWFGMRNAGKSSLVNAVTGQSLSIVSDVPGTTTDPVRKAMELLPLGPVLIIDTPGMDDEGELGQQRVARAARILAQTDIAVLAVDAVRGIGHRHGDGVPAAFVGSLRPGPGDVVPRVRDHGDGRGRGRTAAEDPRDEKTCIVSDVEKRSLKCLKNYICTCLLISLKACSKFLNFLRCMDIS